MGGQENPEWKEALTLEAWVEKMLREGYPEIVRMLLKSIPEEQKPKYREIWKRVMAEKEKGENPDG